MKKFILVDNEGKTADHQQIQAGKFHLGNGDVIDESVAAIMNGGDNSPILAMLHYPGQIDTGLKMFLLNVWNLDGDDGYSIVKEVEMPAITSEHKLAFAIKAVGAIYDFPDYKNWAEGWISGTNRSMDSLKGIQKKIDAEIEEMQGMQEVAYSMGLDIDTEECAIKEAQFQRAKVVFHAAEAALNSQDDQIIDQDVDQVLNGIEEYVDEESLCTMSDEVIKVA